MAYSTKDFFAYVNENGTLSLQKYLKETYLHHLFQGPSSPKSFQVAVNQYLGTPSKSRRIASTRKPSRILSRLHSCMKIRSHASAFWFFLRNFSITGITYFVTDLGSNRTFSIFFPFHHE